MTRPLLFRVLDERIEQTTRQIETLVRLKAELERRRRALASRPPTDHRRGYRGCFQEGDKLIPVSRLQLKRTVGGIPSDTNGETTGGRRRR